jgi:hypothetical protein
MPHQMQQHNQQYNTCSSGAQGMTSIRGNSNFQENQDEFEESKRFSNDMYVSGTGSGGVAGEAGSSNKTG